MALISFRFAPGAASPTFGKRPSRKTRRAGAGRLSSEHSVFDRSDYAFALMATHFPNVPYFVLKAAGPAFCSAWQERAALTTALPCAFEAAFAVLDTHRPKAFDPSAFVP